MSASVSAAAKAPSTQSTSRRTDLVQVKVSENDPGLKATSTAFGFQITGKATNNGTVASFMKLSFDKKTVSLQVSKGDTGATILQKLQKKMPKGYEARLIENLKSNPPQVTIGIAKKATPTNDTKIDAARIPTSIATNGASANVEASISWNEMRGMPRPNAHATINVKGSGFADAPPKFSVKSIDVYEKGTNKKVATIASPKLRGSETIWGQKTQTYGFDIAKADLDRSKQYTFVVNTGINGSKPQAVRSDFAQPHRVF